MIEPGDAREKYATYLRDHTYEGLAGKLTSLTLPFSYPDGDGIQVFFRDLPNGSVEITDYGRTCSFLCEYGAFDARPKVVAGVVSELCQQYEALFDSGQICVRVSSHEIGQGLCCLSEAIQAVAGMVVLADVLHGGGTTGKRVVTRLRQRLNAANLGEVHHKEPIRIDGHSKTHDIRFAYPDRSTLILTQSLRTNPDDQARQVAFDCVDLIRGYEDRRQKAPSLLCVYQAPTDARGAGKMGDVLQLLRSWFQGVYEIDADGKALIEHIAEGIIEARNEQATPVE